MKILSLLLASLFGFSAFAEGKSATVSCLSENGEVYIIEISDLAAKKTQLAVTEYGSVEEYKAGPENGNGPLESEAYLRQILLKANPNFVVSNYTFAYDSEDYLSFSYFSTGEIFAVHINTDSGSGKSQNLACELVK